MERGKNSFFCEYVMMLLTKEAILKRGPNKFTGLNQFDAKEHITYQKEWASKEMTIYN